MFVKLQMKVIEMMLDGCERVPIHVKEVRS